MSKNAQTARWYLKVMGTRPRCAVGETDIGFEDPCSGRLEAHHLAGKVSKEARYDATLGMVLCAHHHRHSTHCSAHGSPASFARWLEAEHPELSRRVKEYRRG